ncbi:MAG: cell division protein FtsK, partial [Actinocatenispora sp.]
MFGRAVAAHREAVAQVRAVHAELDLPGADQAHTDGATVEQSRICEELTAAAHRLVPGWLGTGWDATVMELPVGRDASPTGPVPVLIGTARPEPQASFPAVVPLLGGGHLTIDADARRPEVAGLV